MLFLKSLSLPLILFSKSEYEEFLNNYKFVLTRRKYYFMMFGTFQKDFSQVATFYGYFPKRQLPNSVLAVARGSFPVLATVLGPLAHPSRGPVALVPQSA